MINAFGNYIGFGNREILPEFFVTGSGVEVLTFGDEQVYVFFNTSGSTGQGTGSFLFGNNYECEYLVVGGGGEGGLESGGGAGGGVLSGSFIAQKGIKYDVSVGRGGWWGTFPGVEEDDGAPGSNSFITSSASIPFSLLALGGGGGRQSGARETSSFDNTYQGGSGGGGGGLAQYQAPGSGSVGQGNAGGSGSFASASGYPTPPFTTREYYIGGGGGGAATAGVSGSTFLNGGLPYALPGNGGNGVFGTITQTGSYYGGGGGADYVVSANYKVNNYSLYPTGSGGLGGANAYSSSLDRTGGGGGASGTDYRTASPPLASGPVKYGNGGSGIVVVRFNTKEPIL